jgi:endonuclease/exonuclease/phosphatase (EEP) superfamily protein YafD
LPFGKQRRVAVVASVRPPATSDAPLRLVSFHFDTNAARVRQAEALAGYLRSMTANGTVIAGGDLNAFRGRRDRAFTAIDAALPVEPCGTMQSHVWPFRLDRLAFFRGRIDFLFGFQPGSLDRTCRTLPVVLGSDHRPIVLTIG